MITKIKTLIIAVLALLPISLAVNPSFVYADAVQDSIQSGVNQAAGQKGAPSDPGNTIANTIKTILNVLSAVAGVAAVIMIVIAGFRLVAGAGSEGSVKAAKSGIIYAMIGLLIVAMAQIIVHFVIANVSSTADASPPASGYDQSSNANLH
ncbi:MAG TPA: pilin [Candidatus Saccharimonadales bacterium]|nr:pilin [Candidatus Saccharimonadales bacterium]